MSGKRSKGWLIAAVLWCVILVGFGLGYKFLVHPFFSEKLEQDTGSTSRYQSEIRIAADSFSGYAILRSDGVKSQLQKQGIRLTVQDDRADYDQRLKALKNGEVDLAVFTVDSWIAAGARAGEFPGTIVLIIDETQGSDAIVARPDVLQDLNDLNDADARIVYTQGSPSEFLARVILANFHLPALPDDWGIEKKDAAAVLEEARAARESSKRAYVLWEPYVSRAVDQYGYRVLLDSSKIKGYIVDVLVAQRAFLRRQPEQVDALLQAYLSTCWKLHQNPEDMRQLIQRDARQTTGERLSDEQARKIVDGIQWKNTLENYAHFGLTPNAATAEHQYIEDILIEIVDVLVKTDALKQAPLDGKYHTLFYQQTLTDLKAGDFHPSRSLNIVADTEGNLAPGPAETVRSTVKVAALNETQWARLRPVGELKIKPITFVRGSDRISLISKRDLSKAARKLSNFPEFYLRIIGQTRAEGDAEANQRLAEARAAAVAQQLAQDGIGQERIRTEAAPSGDRDVTAQSVRFVVGQLPY